MENENSFIILEVILKLVGGFIGILAIISAILSTAGFLVLRSHANMLGISSFLYHSVGDYLYEGGYFFLLSIVWAIPASIIGNIYGWLLGIVILFFFLLKSSKWLSRHLSNIARKLTINNLFKRLWIRWLGILLAGFLIIVCIYKIFPSLNAQDLLFVDSSQKSAQLEIETRAAKEGIEKLASNYEDAFIYVILSMLIILGINKIAKHKENQPLSIIFYITNRFKTNSSDLQKLSDQRGEFLLAFGKLILFLLFIVELILLPIKFGQSVYSSEFHQVKNLELNRTLGEKLDNNELIENIKSHESHWLITENLDSYILYSSQSQELIIIPKSQVHSISIKKRQNIFKVFSEPNH